MSRFGDEGWDDDPWRSRLWQIDIERALLTKPGLAALTDLRDALLALPEKRLIPGQACRLPWGEDDEPDPTRPAFCAMGAYLHHKRVAVGEPEEKVVLDLADSRYSSENYGYEIVMEIADAAKRLGMSQRLATHIQWVNDREGDRETEEQRYERVLKWTEATIKTNEEARRARMLAARAASG